MGRSVSVAAVVLIALFTGLLSGCGHSQAVTTNTSSPVPASIALTPGPSASLEVGKTLSFTATPKDQSSTAITETVNYQSSNATVLTISTSGLACAGSWDSLTNPTICTPGPVGVAQVTASVEGVSSPPSTVYVHQHIDSISVNPAPGQSPPTASCFSVGQSFIYQATAYSRAGGPAPGLDITSTVGPFFFQAINSTVVSLTTATATSPVAGLLPGQTQVKAAIPGFTPIFASVDSVTSVPFDVTVCPVQSITLQVNNSNLGSINLPANSSATLTATVLDTQRNQISGNFLSWCSSSPTSVTVPGAVGNCETTSGTTVAATAVSGGSSITASCTPPSCNIGILPTLPVYGQTAVSVTAAAAATSSSSTVTAWITTTGCGTLDNCISQIASVTAATGSGTTPANPVSAPINLTATPNSLVFNREGTKGYLGTDHGAFGAKGLMVFDPTASTVTQFPAVVGKVLAVSPNGNKVIVSDTIDTPNQVFVFDTTNNSDEAFNITGAVAADFSPDNLKAFIVANNGGGTTLYIYSLLDSLQTVPLSSTAQANSVAVLPQGGFAYIAGSPASSVSMVATCNDPAAPAVTTTPTPGTPLMIQALPGGSKMLAVDPPGIDLLVPTVSGSGCSVPRPPFAASGTLSVTNATPVTSVNLGLGNFVPTQLIVSPDGSTAYLLTTTSGSVLVFSIAAHTTSGIQLTGNVLPLQAALTKDGTRLFVAASDGTVHVLDTEVGSDVQQISIPENLTNLEGGLCGNVSFTCHPNLIAVP